MLCIKKRDTKQVFKAIAHQQGVSVSEVKERIQSTIDEMYYSDCLLYTSVSEITLTSVWGLVA